MFTNFISIECCRCHMIFGVSSKFYENRKEDHKLFYCPSCDTGQSFMDMSEKEKLRQENSRLLQRIALKDDEIKLQRDKKEMAQRSSIALKGVITRTKNRIAGGVCPCCNRNFQNLARHMATKHKDYAHKEEVA